MTRGIKRKTELFNDADMNATLGLDGTDQFIVYAASVGRKIS
jgi:hypothetical protein